MFVLFVLSTVNTLELSNFQNFIIKFNETCEEFFLMQGPIDYLYFYQRNNQFELWHIQNDSYEIYSFPHTENLMFHWPDKKINNQEMTLNLFEGTISKPFDFNRTSIMCNVEGITTDIIQEPNCQLYKCPSPKYWRLYILVILSITLFILLIFNESSRTISQPQIRKFLQWITEFLSRSQEGVSTINTEDGQ